MQFGICFTGNILVHIISVTQQKKPTWLVTSSKTSHPSHKRRVSVAMYGVFQVAHKRTDLCPEATQRHVAQNQCCWNSSSISNFLRRWYQTVQRIQQIRLSNESDKSDCPMDESAHLESSEEEDRGLSCVRCGQGECASSKRRQITVTHCA